MRERLFRFDEDDGVKIYQGDSYEILKDLPSDYFHSCITSPPYYGLRDYKIDSQIGKEDTPGEYVRKLVEVFGEVKRVLRDDGTLWVNLGDSYAGAGYSNHHNTGGAQRSDGGKQRHLSRTGFKNKDLLGIPWRIAFALQDDGWYLRQDIIWHKPNVMPESVRDRCTRAHEYIFMLSKSPRYYYDYIAIKEPSVMRPQNRFTKRNLHPKGDEVRAAHRRPEEGGSSYESRNRRSVWSVNTKPYRDAHFATFPPDLIRPCILAGCPEGGSVLDPFGGAGTTGVVARSLGRKAELIELNPDYVEMAKQRIHRMEETV